MEIQIRRECSKPEVVCAPNGALRCPDCRAYTYGKSNSIQHALVTEWRPLADVINEALAEGRAR